jgi:hypothetical protein
MSRTPVIRIRRPADRRSRIQHWNDMSTAVSAVMNNEMA